MRVFLCEKELQAKDVAEALVASPIQRAGSFVCGPDIVTWAKGHLLRQAYPEEYDEKYKHWDKSHLPIVPTVWKMMEKTDRGDQLTKVAEALKRATEIVHACDWDREGQLIGEEIFEYLAIPKSIPIMRLDLHRGNDRIAIQKALGNMRSNTEMLPIYRAALTRQRVDFVYGLSMTRAYTLEARKAGYEYGEVFSVGRVKTPTLAFVVERDLQIEGFTQSNFYVGMATVHHDGGNYDAQWIHDPEGPGTDASGRIVERKIADDMAARTARRIGRITKYDRNDAVKEKPMLPLSLSELQKQANQQYGMTAKQTSDAAQILYEREKIITYPRSPCRYLPEADHKTAHLILHAIARNDSTKARACNDAELSLVSEAWDDTKLASHSAIIPRDKIVNFANLGINEKRVYDLVARGFLAQFYPAATYTTITVEITVADDLFRTTRRILTDKGWRILLPAPKSIQAPPPPLPTQAVGDRVTIPDVRVLEKTTAPPKRYTDATLVADMISVGRRLHDDVLRRALKDPSGEDAGIGTEATRGQIIEDLITDKYIERVGKEDLISTRLGRNLIEALPPDAKSAEMTALYEIRFANIAAGAEDGVEFLRDNVRIIGELVRSATVTPPKRDPTNPDAGRRKDPKRGKKHEKAA